MTATSRCRTRRRFWSTLLLQYGGERWLPRDPEKAADVQRWLSVASGEMAFGLAQARSAVLFGFPYDLAGATKLSHALLQHMNVHLKGSAFLIGDTPTVADVACYSYTAHAPEGRVSLDSYPHVRNWLTRVESLPPLRGYAAHSGTCGDLSQRAVAFIQALPAAPDPLQSGSGVSASAHR